LIDPDPKRYATIKLSVIPHLLTKAFNLLFIARSEDLRGLPWAAIIKDDELSPKLVSVAKIG
jgi:hypothetical protein